MRRNRIHVSSGTYWRAPAPFDRRMMSQIDLMVALRDCGPLRVLEGETAIRGRPSGLGGAASFGAQPWIRAASRALTQQFWSVVRTGLADRPPLAGSRSVVPIRETRRGLFG